MIALCIEVYLLGCVILQRKEASAVVSVILLIVFASLWYGLPFAMRHSRRGGT